MTHLRRTDMLIGGVVLAWLVAVVSGYCMGAFGGLAPRALGWVAATATMGSALVVAWDARERVVRAVATLAVGAATLPAGFVAAQYGLARAVTTVRDDLRYYEAIVRKVEEQPIGRQHTTVPAEGPDRVAAFRTSSGQLVVQITFAGDRRGVIYMSGDSVSDAALPEWFALRKVADRWYFFTA